jgi:hypothetical protein
MENKNRNVWIIVAVVVVLLCCVVAAVAAGAAAVLGWFGTRVSVVETREMSFEVGAGPTLVIDNFAGNIRIQSGSEGIISALAHLRGGGSANVERISVEPSQEGDTVRIRTRRPSGQFSNLAVDLEITVPQGTRIDLTNGAGDVSIDGTEGEIVAHTGAGNVAVSGSEGQVRLDTGAGNVDYSGQPQGTSTFGTGAGNIQISLPAGFAGSVDLETGIGSVDIGGFVVEGSVSPGSARGTIGGGGDATIEAHTGAGDIDLVRR